LIFQGFERVYDNMPDLAIDVPPAYNILERFVTRCRSIGIIDDELLRKMPTRLVSLEDLFKTLFRLP
jgi:programmed cell death protein 4